MPCSGGTRMLMDEFKPELFSSSSSGTRADDPGRCFPRFFIGSWPPPELPRTPMCGRMACDLYVGATLSGSGTQVMTTSGTSSTL